MSHFDHSRVLEPRLPIHLHGHLLLTVDDHSEASALHGGGGGGWRGETDGQKLKSEIQHHTPENMTVQSGELCSTCDTSGNNW